MRRVTFLLAQAHSAHGRNPLPLSLDGVKYFSLNEIAASLGITRMTLYRWRRQQRVPQGNRLRTRHVVFTEAEVEAIKDYATHVEPISREDSAQLRLFGPRP